jgi:hypothetical protein
MSLLEEIPDAWWENEHADLSDLRGFERSCSFMAAQEQTAPSMAEVEAMLSLTGSALLRGEIASRELTAIKESTSWRLTAPLRAVVDAVRRIIKSTERPDD